MASDVVATLRYSASITHFLRHFIADLITRSDQCRHQHFEPATREGHGLHKIRQNLQEFILKYNNLENVKIAKVV